MSQSEGEQSGRRGLVWCGEVGSHTMYFYEVLVLPSSH